MIDDVTKARFWSKVDVSGPEECWEWKASRLKSGYGAFYLNGTVTTASRASLVINGQSVPKGWHVCHKCDNPPCVNPAHLWAGPAKENVDDMHEKGRGHYDKTNSCHKGHLLEGSNVMFRPSAPNVRLCVTCDRAASKSRADKKNPNRGIGTAAENALKTHCPKGHPYSGHHLRFAKNGSRVCRTCHTEYTATRRRMIADGTWKGKQT